MRTLKLSLAVVAIGLLTLTAAGSAAAQGGDAERGAKLFAENCAVCHGADGRGRIGATLTTDFPAIDVQAFVKGTVQNGLPGTRMPAWSQAKGGPLTDQDIADLAAYVELLGGGALPAAPAPTIAPVTIVPAPNVQGDPSLGAIVFQQNCVVCHGDKGQGRIGATLAKQWPAIDPARYVQHTVETGVPGSVMPAWSQKNGGPLNDSDIVDVTAYVLSLKPVGGATPSNPPAGGLSFTTSLIGLLLIGVLIVAALVFYYRRAK